MHQARSLTRRGCMRPEPLIFIPHMSNESSTPKSILDHPPLVYPETHSGCGPMMSMHAAPFASCNEYKHTKQSALACCWYQVENSRVRWLGSPWSDFSKSDLTFSLLHEQEDAHEFMLKALNHMRVADIGSNIQVRFDLLNLPLLPAIVVMLVHPCGQRSCGMCMVMGLMHSC